MYIEGIVSKTDGYRAKLKLEDYDDMETQWLVIPQLFTVDNKSGYIPAIGTLAAAVTNEDMTEGCLIGAIYNDVDTPPETSANEFIEFSDGVKIKHTTDTQTLEIEAENIVVKGNIVCSGDVSDGAGTIQSIRDWANSHVHTNGNDGANTGTPTSTI